MLSAILMWYLKFCSVVRGAEENDDSDMRGVDATSRQTYVS